MEKKKNRQTTGDFNRDRACNASFFLKIFSFFSNSYFHPESPHNLYNEPIKRFGCLFRTTLDRRARANTVRGSHNKILVQSFLEGRVNQRA